MLFEKLQGAVLYRIIPTPFERTERVSENAMDKTSGQLFLRECGFLSPSSFAALTYSPSPTSNLTPERFEILLNCPPRWIKDTEQNCRLEKDFKLRVFPETFLFAEP
jgi:hypothetical protein